MITFILCNTKRTKSVNVDRKINNIQLKTVFITGRGKHDEIKQK